MRCGGRGIADLHLRHVGDDLPQGLAGDAGAEGLEGAELLLLAKLGDGKSKGRAPEERGTKGVKM
jgi:hypothetical protein